jgi:hypothetical protein
MLDYRNTMNTLLKERCLSPHTINTFPLTKQGALKLKDACGYLGGISPSSLRRLIERGLVRPNRALRHILIPIAELDRFLEGGQQ